MFQSLSEKLANAFKKFRSKGKLTASDVKEGMREIKLALLEADVNFKVVRDFIKTVSERAVGAEVLESLLPAQQVVKIVNEELINLMGKTQAKLEINPKPPTVVMMVGLQGAGKTTHSGKLAGLYKKQGKSPLLVACDVYRPAAIKQLQVVGEKLDIPVYAEEKSKNPVSIAKNALDYAKKHGNDMVFIDTAGRLHIDETLMKELQDIKKAVSPTEILLVVDAMLGQDAVNVAETFNEMLDITGVVLTKLDGDTRGGAALSVRYVTGKPIKFVGTGEKLDTIEP
ncbi:MAG: signal recognition particle protein, partial [Eubacteriales bacterium]